MRRTLVVSAALLAIAAASPAQTQERPAEALAVQAGAESEAQLSAPIEAAYHLLESGKIDEGFSALLEALNAAARTDRHAFTIRQYTQAASLFHENGLNDQAAQLFKEGSQTRAAQADIAELADFYLAYAQFRTVVVDPEQHFVPLFTMATNLYDRHYGRESRELINATDLMAAALGNIGQLGTAINLMQGNYDVALKALGPDDTITWRLANNLADVLRGLGAPARALEFDRVVLEKRIAHYGRDHFNTLVSANNNAQDHLDLGDYAEARLLLEMCREIVAATGDTANAPVMDAWLEYTDLLAGKKAFDDAAAERMNAVVTDAEYPAILSLKAANLLAEHFRRTGDQARRMEHLEQAYGIAGSNMSTTHPLTFAGRIAIANAKAETDTKAAAAEFADIDAEMLRWVYLQVFYAGNRDLVETMRAMADDMLHDYAALAERDPSVVAAFADAARRWPSLSSVDNDNVLKLARLIDADDTETAEMLAQITRLSRASREVFAVGTEMEMGYALVEQTRALEERLHERVTQRYNVTRETMAEPLPAAGEVLQNGQALVQYFVTRKWKANRDLAEPLDATTLYAIVSRNGREPALHNLGDPRAATAGDEAKQMASLRTTRSAAERGASPIVAAADASFADLHATLVEPLETDLAGAETVFVIPDGQLFAVPFSLLKDHQGRLLEERFTLRFLTRPEALHGVGAEQTSVPGAVVLAGGIDYRNGDEKGAEPLPGTLKEVNAIGAILGGKSFAVEKLTGAEVGEAVLRGKMEGARIAHLATHGAYRSAGAGGSSDVDTLWQSDIILSRSGDRHAMRRDEADGRLYAFELMGWDLTKLDLLVLSACETGRGEETFVGGLRGLPTAIGIAGAKRSLLTLWPVDDQGTAEFMVRFYEHLAGGMTYADALRQTRRDAIGGRLPAAQNPLVWAAFVMFEN
ncbi:MAG: CHAT domain-containing protein [Rhizobiaceae bacterium]|nr:CHAT domain-containing protein [Rhizobiaceae bacterium]